MSTPSPSADDPGSPDELERHLGAVLDGLGLDGADRRRLVGQILRAGAQLALDEADRLDLKITAAALRELRDAYRVFAPWREVPKITVFGSARAAPGDPLLDQARRLGRAMADEGWIVVTGAGPGLMAAATEGAGPERTIGVSIRLPWEPESNEVLRGSGNLVVMKYFFTRKLMLVKESSAFVSLPGGLGTLDETLELLTLQQTGKAEPSPIVLLDAPGGQYWSAFQRFVDEHLVTRGFVAADDGTLYCVTDSVEEACATIHAFYASFHSVRQVGEVLVVRLRRAPSPQQLTELNERFGDLCVSGSIHPVSPTHAEVSDRDHLDLPRLGLRYDRRRAGRLRAFIDALNQLPQADAAGPIPARG